MQIQIEEGLSIELREGLVSTLQYFISTVSDRSEAQNALFAEFQTLNREQAKIVIDAVAKLGPDEDGVEEMTVRGTKLLTSVPEEKRDVKLL